MTMDTGAGAGRWRLYSSPTSPFVRKVRIVAIEKGLNGRIEQVQQNPFVEEDGFVAKNPISQIPTFEADGLVITDSALIVDWLEAYGQGPRLVPEGEAQWEVRQRAMFADGVQQCGIRWRIENLRDASIRWPEWVERLQRGLQRGFDRLEETLPGEEVFDLGVINAIVACAYLSYRHPGYDWRTGRPKLVERMELLQATRPSFMATIPGTPIEDEDVILARA